MIGCVSWGLLCGVEGESRNRLPFLWALPRNAFYGINSVPGASPPSEVARSQQAGEVGSVPIRNRPRFLYFRFLQKRFYFIVGSSLRHDQDPRQPVEASADESGLKQFDFIYISFILSIRRYNNDNNMYCNRM